MNSIICEPYQHMCLYMCVMVDQREALAVTTCPSQTKNLIHKYIMENHGKMTEML
jgi:hypothetical protein